MYKCLGAGFWALKQNNFRKALQKITMEVRALFGENVSCACLCVCVCVCVCVCLCAFVFVVIACKSLTCYTDIILVSRSSRPEVFCHIGVLKSFAKFTGKHLCWRLLFKKESSTQVFPCEFCEIFRNTFFYRTPPMAASALASLWCCYYYY